MSDAVAFVRLFGLMTLCLLLGVAFFVRQTGRAAAAAGARVGAASVADALDAGWDCTLSAGNASSDHGAFPAAEAERIAAAAVLDRLGQVSAVQPTAVTVTATPTCSVIVAVSVVMPGAAGLGRATAVACRTPEALRGTALNWATAHSCGLDA